ncbi:MAG: AbrB family transcriptional regulator [Dokdonella sp.]
MTIDLARWPRAAQWMLLGACSIALAGLLLALQLPAALLLGPMLAGIVCGTHGASVRTPAPTYIAAQAIVGVMIANTMTPAIVQMFYAHWPWFLVSVLATLAGSSGLGVVLSRYARSLPGTTAIWGVTPGAATAMVLMAESFGADARLVAFGAAAVAHLWLHLGSVAHVPIAWFAAFDPAALAATLAVAVVGAAVGVRLALPAGALLLPAIAAIALHLGGHLRIELPPWLLAATYAAVGWTIGLRFTRESLRYAVRALGPILLSIVALLALCGALSWLLAYWSGENALSAYLAMSPGGMDTVAIIAASSPQAVDLPFVMALQTARLLLVIAFGPALARFVAARAQPRSRTAAADESASGTDRSACARRSS